MTKRYYQLTDEKMLAALKSHHERIKQSVEIAKQFAIDNNLDRPLFSGHHLFDRTLAGFEAGDKYREYWRSTGLMTKPANNLIRPKAVKKSEIREKVDELRGQVNLSDSELHDVLGWHTVDYILYGVGVNANYEKMVVIFSTRAEAKPFPGCKEISNLDYIELTKKK